MAIAMVLSKQGATVTAVIVQSYFVTIYTYICNNISVNHPHFFKSFKKTETFSIAIHLFFLEKSWIAINFN